MTVKKPVPLILFSGGLDSSYALQEKLKEGDVETLYVTGAQHPYKVTKEREVRESIIRRLEAYTGNKVREDYHVELGRFLFGDVADSAFKQPGMWITGALQISDARKHSELVIGYVAGDQIMSNLPDVRDAWHAMQGFTKSSGVVPVNFPLSQMTKQQIMREIRPDIVNLVWVCEMPVQGKNGELRPCGGSYECAACNTTMMNQMLWRKLRGEHYWQTKLREYRIWQEAHPNMAAQLNDAEHQVRSSRERVKRSRLEFEASKLIDD